MAKPIKICFISLNSYPLFVSKSTGYFGGAEVQISLIVKNLIKDPRFKVSLVVGDYGQKQVIKKGRLTIYKCFKHDSRNVIQILRFLITLVKINADVYVERTMNPKVGLVAWISKLFNKKFIYMLAHLWDSTNKLGGFLKGAYKNMFIYGLKKTDLIICQTKDQQKLLNKNYDLKSILMPSLAIKPIKSSKQKKEFILWVGRADDWKRPKSFLDLVDKFTQERLVMVCRKGNDIKLFNQAKKLAMRKKNLKFFPVVPIEDIIKLFGRAKLFINTSVEEGFPNTFLQAGLTKTPVLSLTVNPDQYITKFNCGLVAGNKQEKLVKNLKQILKSPKLRKQMGLNNYYYVKKNHSLKNVNIFKQTLLELF